MNLFLHSPQPPWFRMHMDDVKDVDGVTYVEYLKDGVTDANGANDSIDENSVDDVNDHSTMRMIIQCHR